MSERKELLNFIQKLKFPFFLLFNHPQTIGIVNHRLSVKSSQVSVSQLSLSNDKKKIPRAI